ncbi:MAG: hypothetical protein AAFR11_03480 [Pseudomonadota bacterium]
MTETRELVPVNRARPLYVESLGQAQKLAETIAQAGIAPKGMQRPEQIFIAICQGAEVGLGPMQAVQSIAVINGRPTMWGDALLALVQGDSSFEDIEERIEGEGDERRAVCTLKRKGRTPTARTFSVADAKRAKLWGKTGRDGQDTPWITYPERMLQMRARAWAIRDGAADLLRGVRSREEEQDIDAGEARMVGETSAPPPPPRPPEEMDADVVREEPARKAPPPPPPPVQNSDATLHGVAEAGGAGGLPEEAPPATPRSKEPYAGEADHYALMSPEEALEMAGEQFMNCGAEDELRDAFAYWFKHPALSFPGDRNRLLALKDKRKADLEAS